MNLIAILLVVMAILALASGVAVIIGAGRRGRWYALAFVVMMLAVAGWAALMAVRLWGWQIWNFGPEQMDLTIYIMMGVMLMSLAGYVLALKRLHRPASKKRKYSNSLLAVGVIMAVLAVAWFVVAKWLWQRDDLLWIAPLAVIGLILSVYYATLRYQLMVLTPQALRVFSYAVIMALAVMVYMVLFYVVFAVLFKIEDTSGEVIALNFVMVVIVLILVSIINEISTVVRSLISVREVNIAYIVKKLNKVAAESVDLDDLAEFLADHLHFSYIGFLVKGKLYGSKELAISRDELKEVAALKPAHRGIWQNLSESVARTFDQLEISAVAELYNASGKAFGQILVGQPLGRRDYERRDLIQLEMTINLVAAIIDSERYLKA